MGKFGLLTSLMASAAGLVVAQGASYSNSVSLGAIIISAAVGVATLIGIVYGIRYRTLAKTLEAERDAEHKRGDRIDRDFDEAKERLREQQSKHEAYREEKHAIVDDLTSKLRRAEADLALEKQKHDYSQLVATVAQLHTDLDGRTPLFEEIIASQNRTATVLDRIVGVLDVLLARENGDH